MKDVVEAFMLALSHPNCDGDVINVGSGTVTTINKLTHSLLELTGQHGLLSTYAASREGEFMNMWADIGKAHKVLGFTPGIKIYEGSTCLDQQEDEQESINSKRKDD